MVSGKSLYFQLHVFKFLYNNEAVFRSTVTNAKRVRLETEPDLQIDQGRHKIREFPFEMRQHGSHNNFDKIRIRKNLRGLHEPKLEQTRLDFGNRKILHLPTGLQHKTQMSEREKGNLRG